MVVDNNPLESFPKNNQSNPSPTNETAHKTLLSVILLFQIPQDPGHTFPSETCNEQSIPKPNKPKKVLRDQKIIDKACRRNGNM